MPELGYFLPIAYGIVHGILFTLLLAGRGIWRQQIADLLLASLLVAGSLRMLPYVLGFLDINILWNQWLLLPLDTGLLIGPLFWLFLRARTNPAFRPGPTDLLHLIPYGIFAAYRLAVFSRDSDFVFEWIDRVDLPVIQPMVGLLTGASLAVYLLLSFRLLSRFRDWLDDEFSDVQGISLPWLRSFVFALGLAVLTSWVFGLLEMVGTDFDAWQAWWPFATNTAALYYLSVAGLTHPQSARVTFPADTVPEGATGLSDHREWVAKLGTLMEAKRLYLRPDLVLDEVAAELAAPKAIVSQAINEGFGMNFRSFVNAYRVESVRHALATDTELTLIGIALDHGFKSKATFNRVFKQLAGMTPREYAELSEAELAQSPSLIPVPRIERYSNEKSSTTNTSA